MPCTLYYFEISPPSRAVWMTIKELGMDCEYKIVNLLKGEQNSEEFLKMNPSHCVPTIDDNGFYLWESRAIMAYLAGKYDKTGTLYPKDPKKRAMVDQYLNYDLGTVFANNVKWGFPQINSGEAPNPESTETMKKSLQALNDEHLAKKSFVTGDKMTIADLSLCASVTFLEMLNFDFSPYSNIKAWLDKVKARPYYQESHDKMMECLEMIKAAKAQQS